MAKVTFKTDAKISISNGAVEYARKLIEEENKENRKLRELIEKRIKEIGKHKSLHGVFNDYVKPELQELIEDSKK